MARPGVSTRKAYRRSGRALRRVRALAGAVPSPDGTRVLLASLADPSLTVRRTAVVALAIQRDPGALEGLAEILRHGPDRARDRALRVLEGWASSPDEDLAQTLAPVARIGLSDARAWNRRRAVSLLGVLGRVEDAGPLRACLAEDDTQLREAAVEAIVKLGDASAWADLLPLLDDPDTLDLAARGLASLGDPRAAPKLIEAWLAAPGCRAVAEALGRLGDSRAIEPLLAGLGDPHCADEVALALLRLGDRRGWPWVRDRFESSSWPSPSVVEALAHFGGPEDLAWIFDAPSISKAESWFPERTPWLLEQLGRRDLRALERGLRDSSIKVRLVVVRVLGKFSREEAGEAGSSALRAALSDPDSRVMWFAARVLGGRADPAAAADLLAKIEDPSTWPGDVETFAETLGQIGDPSVVPALLRALPRFEGNPRFRLVEALAALAGEEAKATFIELLRDPDWRIRYRAIGALARNPDARGFRALRELAEGGDDGDRSAVSSELGAFAQPGVVELLARGLESPRSFVRSAALLGLQQVSDPLADGMVRAALGHEDPSTRAAAVWAALARGLEPAAWLGELAQLLARERYAADADRLMQVVARLDELDAWPPGFDPRELREQAILLRQGIRARRLEGEVSSRTSSVRARWVVC